MGFSTSRHIMKMAVYILNKTVLKLNFSFFLGIIIIELNHMFAIGQPLLYVCFILTYSYRDSQDVNAHQLRDQVIHYKNFQILIVISEVTINIIYFLFRLVTLDTILYFNIFHQEMIIDMYEDILNHYSLYRCIYSISISMDLKIAYYSIV